KFRLMPIGCFNLAALVFDLPEQTGVMDCQSGLGRKRLQQIDHLRFELTSLASANCEPAQNLLLSKKRHGKKRPVTEASDQWACTCPRKFPLFEYVRYLHGRTSDCRLSRSPFAEADLSRAKTFDHFFLHAVGCS